MPFRKKLLISSSIALVSVALVGCSSGPFRNRNFDYLHQDVKQVPAIKTPKGLNAPETQAYYPIPAGQDQYAPTEKVDLAPPNADKAYHYTPPKKAKASAKPAEKGAETAASVAALNKKADQLKAKLATLQKQKVEAKPVKPAKALASSAPKAVPVKPVLPPLSASLMQNEHGANYLQVQASLAQIWQRVPAMFVSTGYHVTSTQKDNGFIFVSPDHKPAAGNTLLLSLEALPQKDLAFLYLYDPQGKPDTSAQGRQLLDKVRSNLGG